MNSQKIAGDVKGYAKVGQDLGGNFNDTTMSSLKSKYEILENNFLELVKAVKDNNQELEIFDGKREFFWIVLMKKQEILKTMLVAV